MGEKEKLNEILIIIGELMNEENYDFLDQISENFLSENYEGNKKENKDELHGKEEKS